ncbi:MAG TPA: hypothetical protein ENK66_02540 [Arcobacter sp.]|nr:hypothetical protein [Arcobacter sp.]
MRNKLKFFLALLVSFLPFSVVRVFLYNTLFSFEISNSTIGWLTILHVQKFFMKNGKIGSFNFFTGPYSVVLESQNRVGSFNYIRCGSWAVNFKQISQLCLKKEAKIENQHYFDVFGTITIGRQSIIAGIRSQFWTHGSFSDEVNIVIGDNCYIGSGVKFTPNSEISKDSVCAMGSVVSKRFKEEAVVIAGVPAKVIKHNVDWRKEWK